MISIPPANVGDVPTSAISFPSQNVILPLHTSMLVTAVQPGIVPGTTNLTLEAKSMDDVGYTLQFDVTSFIVTDTGNMVDSAPRVQTYIEINPISILPISSFLDVTTVNPNTATVTYTDSTLNTQVLSTFSGMDLFGVPCPLWPVKCGEGI